MAAVRSIPQSVNGWSAEFIEAQYGLYRRDPASVSPDMRSFFLGFDLAQAGELPLTGATPRPLATVAAGERASTDAPAGTATASNRSNGAPGGQPSGRASHFQSLVDDLIESYRALGHIAARLDPFGRVNPEPEALRLEFYGLSEADLDREVNAAEFGFQGPATLRQVIELMRSMYCGTVGVEFMHIQDTERRQWLTQRLELARGRIALDRGKKAHVLELLTQAESFETFLGKRYPGDKRFSLEGSESLIPLLDEILESATDHGVEEIVLGMAHRGRLNVLNSILGKSNEQIFTEFEETWTEDFIDGGGDVKYHRGYSGTRRFRNGRMLHLAMASNPSHLESVNPVVLGRCRAKQRLRGDKKRLRVVPLVIHGDAAITGQGIVAECLNMSGLEGYRVGGCIHVVVNNQIGFTTVPEDSRSSRYCTDIGKSADAPIFHVNGDDPEAVVACARFAIEYRQRFQQDVFIDLVCFRKYGHNEQDEMSFTQPLLARLIAEKKSVLATYSAKLLAEGTIQDADLVAIRHRLEEALEKAQAAARSTPYDPTIDPGSERWRDIGANKNAWSFAPVDTGVPIEVLTEVSASLGRLPDGFNLNRKLQKLITDRRTITEGWLDADTPEKVTYAEAESLAFGSLLLEGHPIRLSGQDCRRGTFSHRHAVLRDAETGVPYTPLNSMRNVLEPDGELDVRQVVLRDKDAQARFCVYDSPLSEAAVLGFDYGYSLADPHMLVCWEAQFGDFANGAQVIFDQYIASAEAKWGRWSGLVVLLPHGYEGQGPEHSSARMERFLQLCGNNNMQVVYPTTGAQCFHMFRRQVKRAFRKPLIVMSPKSLLRSPTSRVEQLISGQFQELIDDPYFNREGQNRAKVTRIVLVCGKLFYDLDQRRRDLGRSDVAIVRVEQAYPFHSALFQEIRSRYPAQAELVYAQEEPRNMAAYHFVADHLVSEGLVAARPRYIGRPASASPATGSKKQHKYEQEKIITEAIGAKPADSKPAEPKSQLAGVH